MEQIEKLARKLAPKDTPEEPAFPNHTDTDIWVSGFKEGFMCNSDFTYEELMFIGISAYVALKNIKAQDDRVPYTPAARAAFKDMIAAGTSLANKMESMGFPVINMRPFTQEDYDTLLTKES